MKLLYLFALFPILLSAQQLQPVTSVQADCGKFSSPIRVAGTFTTAIVDNRQAGCDGWVVTYSSNGFATVSVLLQSAPLGTGGIAGTFVNFAGTIVTGFTNPTTATTQGEIRATGYFPYVRLQITTTGAGYLQAEFHGFKNNPNSGSGAPSGSGGCVGTAVTPCVVDGPNANGSAPTKPPVLVAGSNGTIVKTLLTNAQGGQIPAGVASVDLGDGVNFTTKFTPLLTDNSGTQAGMGLPIIPYLIGDLGSFNRALSCTNRANVTLTTIGATKIITNPGFLTIHICSLSLSFASPVDIQVIEGTGATCGTGSTNMTGLFRSVIGFDPTWGSNAALTQSTFNDDVCISMSASVNGGGVVLYSAF